MLKFCFEEADRVYKEKYTTESADQKNQSGQGDAQESIKSFQSVL